MGSRNRVREGILSLSEDLLETSMTNILKIRTLRSRNTFGNAEVEGNAIQLRDIYTRLQNLNLEYTSVLIPEDEGDNAYLTEEELRIEIDRMREEVFQLNSKQMIQKSLLERVRENEIVEGELSAERGNQDLIDLFAFRDRKASQIAHLKTELEQLYDEKHKIQKEMRGYIVENRRLYDLLKEQTVPMGGEARSRKPYSPYVAETRSERKSSVERTKDRKRMERLFRLYKYALMHLVTTSDLNWAEDGEWRELVCALESDDFRYIYQLSATQDT